MNQLEFTKFVAAAAQRAVKVPGRVGCLCQAQNVGRIREPEMRHVLALESLWRTILHRIEVPTVRKYRFIDGTDGYAVSGRHDLVLLHDSHEQPREQLSLVVLIELKSGQPGISTDKAGIRDCNPISKDLRKLMLEPAATGGCTFQVLNELGCGTLPALMKKYQLAWSIARNIVADRIQALWFFFILVQPKRTQDSQMRPILYYAGITDLTKLDPECSLLK